MDHLPDKETRKRKPKKTFEIDFNDDVNFDTYFRTTRVKTFAVCSFQAHHFQCGGVSSVVNVALMLSIPLRKNSSSSQRHKDRSI